MNSKNFERAQILVQALPYIQKYNGKVIVVKYQRTKKYGMVRLFLPCFL